MEVLNSDDKAINAIELIELYRHEGWWEERKEHDIKEHDIKEHDIKEMLKQTISVGAWDKDRLIGFARAVTDNNFRAYVEDVVVLKDYRKSQVGTELVSQLLMDLSHIDVVSLFCGKELIPFYENNHFKFSESQYVMHKK